MRIKPLVLAVALALPLGAAANIEQQVNQMFGTMINATAPGSYKTASRGVVTGGNLVVRNRIKTANIISITPPSAKGGCGGINLYSGSFSFINGEEFVALMRNVASNAVGVISGYAFEMALELMDAQTAGVIRNLANKIQSLNQMFSNSCQLAQGVMSGGVAAFKEGGDLKSAMTAFGENVAPDFFSAKSTKEASPAERIVTANKAKACANTGNIIWCAMKKAGLASQIMYGSDENAEFIMSMVGSFYITLTPDDKGGKNFQSQPMQPLIKGDSLKIFVEGSTGTDTKVYKCASDDTDQCIKPTVADLRKFDGLERKMIKDIVDSGVIERVASNAASAADIKKLEYFTHTNIGRLLMQIIQKAGANRGEEFFSEFARVIAAEAANSVINQLLDETAKGLTSLEMPEATVVAENLRDTRVSLSAEYRNYLRYGTNAKDADRRAAEMLQSSPVPDDGTLPQGTLIQNAGA